ncbi:MAG: phospho-sugar mutase [Defluviitaleaceae bacterium]|nr:phospho-sugar mutase [Defluviitaleaceae bacterium]
MPYKETFNYWLNDPYFDKKTKAELEAIKDNEEEIKERFYKDLEFGTAGLRGILGAGTNRMNLYTVGKATQGLANYLLQEADIDHTNGVAIAYDPRNMSQEFATHAALVFNANGIKSYIYNSIRPTPQLSFTVRRLGCAAGVMVTASHNPPEYNGYKVYGPDGAQVNYPYDERIINHVNAIVDFNQIKLMDIDKAKEQGLFNRLSPEIDEEFLEECKSLAINPDVIEEGGDMPIVYTPIHGAGYVPTKKLLERVGFTNVHIVAEQAEPNGNFPTVKYPNPEEASVFELATKLAKEVNADIIVGADPDADRIGVVCKDDVGQYIHLNGNMVGVILTEYILSQKKAKGQLPANAAVITSIVSTDMTKVIAEAYGTSYFDVFTGFKYVGEKVKKFEKDKSHKFVYAFEESYGYLCGDYARDKDAIGITMLICEVATFYKTRHNLTLYQALQEIYEKYGFYKEETVSLTLKGLEGVGKIKRIMAYFVDNPISEIEGTNVVEYRNYNTGINKNMVTNEEFTMDFPRSNVLYFKLEDETWMCVRPSGTEPKIKIYFGVVRKTGQEATKALEGYKTHMLKIVDEIE